ncbi:MAG TPA: (Fe-S)-binding protein [Fimbriimonas sp.]|nr:(Fe-S)-binding protein [Fimbriimonas sp.]
MKIDLFLTCMNDAMFPKTGIATVQVLESLGHEVCFDQRQTCCGQMHLNSGYQEEAISLAKRWMDIYKDAEVVVSPSGSCVANVREMFANLGKWTNDQALIEQAHHIESKVFELSEFLVNVLEIENVGAIFPHKVTYHPTCHGARMLQLGDAPMKLLRNVQGIEIVELDEATQCCGFGGTFSVKNADTSNAMLDDKCANIESTGAEYCVALDNSCLMHIGGGLSKQHKKARPIHLAEVLASRGPQ